MNAFATHTLAHIPLGERNEFRFDKNDKNILPKREKFGIILLTPLVLSCGAFQSAK